MIYGSRRLALNPGSRADGYRACAVPPLTAICVLAAIGDLLHMFERRKIRTLLENLAIEATLDQELGHYYWEEFNSTKRILARDCKALDVKGTVALLWDLIQVSRNVGCRQLIWVIGAAKSPGVWAEGPSMADEARLGRFGFWFPNSTEKGCLRVHGRMHYGNGIVSAGNVAVVRVSQQEYRASLCCYCNLRDLSSMHWRSKSYW